MILKQRLKAENQICEPITYISVDTYKILNQKVY